MNYKFSFKLISFFLFIALFLPKCFSSNREDAFSRAIEKTAELHSFNGELSLTRKKIGITISYHHSLNKDEAVVISYMSFDTKEQAQAFNQLVEVFGKAAEEMYDNAPKTKISKMKLESVNLKFSEFPKCKLHSPIYNTDVDCPRTRYLYFSPSPTDIIRVHSIGDIDPTPIMVTLIKEMKAEGILGETKTERFNVSVTAKGFKEINTYFESNNFKPNKFSLKGKIVDKENKPILGAEINISNYNKSVITDVNGYYSISISFEKGSKPFDVNGNFTLVSLTGNIKTIFNINSVLPAPGETVLEIKSTSDGLPFEGKVQISTDSSPFVSVQLTEGKLDKDGTFKTPVDIKIPDNIENLSISEKDLNVLFKVTVFPADGGKSSLETINIPLNLSLITGITTGPDMKPRNEKEPPSIADTSKEMVVGQVLGQNGEFKILVHPNHPNSGKQKKRWEIVWSEANRLPLELPLSQNPEPGQVINLGKIDLLTPDEHVIRLKKVLSDFGKAMPLTLDEQNRFQKAVARLNFQDGTSRTVPSFQDNFFDDSGVVYVPGNKFEYWGKNLLESNISDDPAYEIIPHEMGHFIHHNIVERYSYRNICYNKSSTGTHNTWNLEQGVSFTKLPYISFSENTADFFALLFRNFWVNSSPEIKDSLYFKKKGYLHEFEDDTKPFECLSKGIKGYQLEGIQTRFLSVYYGKKTLTQPANVMNDYLNTMLLYMDTKTFTTGSLTNRPARTISQWAYTKSQLPGAIGHSDAISLATRYKVNHLEPEPTASPVFKQKEVEFYIDENKVDFGSYQVSPALYDNRLKLTKGMVGIDLSDFNTRRTLIMKAPCEIKIMSRTQIIVYKGLVSIDFQTELLTPGGKVKPIGTVIQVLVKDNGNTLINVLKGKAQIETTAGDLKEIDLAQSVELNANGTLGTITTCQPEKLFAQILPDVQLPKIVQSDKISGNTLNINELKKQISKFPWWALLIALMLSIGLLITLIYLLRFVIIALLIAPIFSSLLLFCGRLLLRSNNIEQMDFLTHLFSPFTVFQTNMDWLPAISWLLGAFFAGLLLNGGIKGFLSGLLFPIIPLFFYNLHSGFQIQENFHSFFNFLFQSSKITPKDIFTLVFIAAMGGFIGGLLSPRKKSEQNIQENEPQKT